LTKKTTELAVLTAISTIIFTIESLIPSPFPIIRIGLANVITLIVLQSWGMREALTVVIIRILLGSLLTGRLLSPLFVMSITGGIASTLVMTLLIKYFQRSVSLIGTSIAGAAVHNIVQMYTASRLFIKSIEVTSILPLFIFSSIITGAIVGIVAVYSLKIISLNES